MPETPDSRLKIGELPDLRIVAADAILLHEEPDAARSASLERRLRSEGVIKNPPIVADPGGGVFIVLDGANRVSALRNLGIRRLPVQVVPLDDPTLEIRTWHHAVERLERRFFARALGADRDAAVFASRGAVPGRGSSAAAGATPESGHGAAMDGYLCAFTFASGDALVVENHVGVFDRVSALDRITGLYRDGRFFDRVSYTNMEDLRLHYPDFTALVSFQPFLKSEILEVVRAGRRLPSGITRVVLPKRALGIDVSLEFLERPGTLEEKRDGLRDLIQRRVAGKSIRFYEEPTFRFDE
jgi:hypothetical protein